LFLYPNTTRSPHADPRHLGDPHAGENVSFLPQHLPSHTTTQQPQQTTSNAGRELLFFQLFPYLFRDFSATFPRLFRDFSAGFPTYFPATFSGKKTLNLQWAHRITEFAPTSHNKNRQRTARGTAARFFLGFSGQKKTPKTANYNSPPYNFTEPVQITHNPPNHNSPNYNSKSET
jgi:hypothetical protein